VIAAIERFIALVGRATAWLALAIVLLMATNVVLRYLFSYGSVWSQELEWHLLVPLIMFSVAFALQQGEHVRVDVLYARFSPRTQALVNVVSAVLCLAISALALWFSVKYVQQSYVIDEQSADPGGLTHRWVLKALIPAGFVLLGLQSVAEIAKSAATARRAKR
jgi:TRAP-type mannitol/chloroaromatic compound transport system permease small subunit